MFRVQHNTTSSLCISADTKQKVLSIWSVSDEKVPNCEIKSMKYNKYIENRVAKITALLCRERKEELYDRRTEGFCGKSFFYSG